jgi:hypothetical protein
VHQEALQLLIAGGPLALLAVVMGCRLLWRRGSRGGLTRALLIAALAASVFRQTLNFRHTAILLALALAMEYWDRHTSSSSADVDAGAAEAVAESGGSVASRPERRERRAW